MRVACAAKNCKYSLENEDSSRVIFINFPNDDTSKIWAHHCGRTDLLIKSNEELHLNYCICSHHIEDRYYISKREPIIIEQCAVPTLFDSDLSVGKDPENMFDRADSVALAYCDMDSEIDQYRDISVRFSNLCRICGEPTTDGIEIFAAKGIELKLKDKIGLHLPITVDVEDLMPQKLCMDCYNKLEVAHSLVQTSLRTDMRLRRFSNIDREPGYDGRFNAVVEECSLEVVEEMCMDEATQPTSLRVSSDKVEEIRPTEQVAAELSQLESKARRKSNFENSARNEMHSELSNLIDSYEEENKNVDYTENVEAGREINETASGISCLVCKDSFKTREIFENHKILCDEVDVILVQSQKEMSSNINSKEMEILDFEFVSKTCNNCEENFETEKLYDEHKISYCKEKHYEISEDLNLNANEDVRISKEELKIVPVESNKKCGHCELVYSSKKELFNHLTECHDGKFLFKCFLCNKSFEKWPSLDVHEATHRIDKPYLCDLCGKRFKHSNNLRGHKRTHLDESKKKRHVCEICATGFRSRFHLREHMNQHDGTKPYSCDKCGKAFFKRIQLRQHKLSHGLNRHVCPICGTTFNRRGNMNTHLKRHNKQLDGTYTCSVCAYRCKSMSELKLHRKTHTEEDIVESIRKNSSDKTIWQCKICNRVFSKRAVLENHERIHRAEKTSVDCEICGKRLASKSSLIYHKKSMHSSERGHVCQYCGDSFVSREARLIHERVHTGERPYVCTICNMQYKCSSNLNQHLKIHSGIRPHECGYCNKRFTRKGALNVHERIHTGVKPFSCETCARTFSQKNDMLKHARTHEPKSMRCEQCNQVFTRKKDILKHVVLHEQKSTVIQEYVQVQQPFTIL